jgi:hypothetical protein
VDHATRISPRGILHLPGLRRLFAVAEAAAARAFDPDPALVGEPIWELEGASARALHATSTRRAIRLDRALALRPQDARAAGIEVVRREVSGEVGVEGLGVQGALLRRLRALVVDLAPKDGRHDSHPSVLRLASVRRHEQVLGHELEMIFMARGPSRRAQAILCKLSEAGDLLRANTVPIAR